MRTIFVLLGLSMATLSACQCGPRVVVLAPQVEVTEPTEKRGDDYVIDFGSIERGTSASRSIRINNRGNAAARLTKMALREGSDVAFSLDATGERTLQSASDFLLTVTYAPKGLGNATGYVDVETDDPKLPKFTVQLIGRSIAGSVEVCVEGTVSGNWTCAGIESGPLEIDFGSVLVGSPAVSRRVRVRNTGTSNLAYLGSVLIDPSSPLFSFDPSQDVPQGGNALAPNAELIFSVVFNPAAAGTVSGTAEVLSTDSVLPFVDILLKAVAAETLFCRLTVSPQAPTGIAYGNVILNSTVDRDVVMGNTGSQPCFVSALSLTGNPPFALHNLPGLPLQVDPGTTAKFTVRYQPTSAAAATGNVTIVSDDPMKPTINVPLSGTGITQPKCLLVATPSMVDFGGVAVGDRKIVSVKLTATGSEPCNVTGARIQNGTPAFSAQVPVPLFIAPGGLPMFGGGNAGVSYAPTATGSHADTMIITYMVGFLGPTVSLSVPLTGKAGTKRLCVSPPHLAYGDVATGASKTLPFTMTACGGASVKINSITIEPTGTPFTLGSGPTLPAPIAISMSATQSVTVTPPSNAPNSAQVHIVSDDPTFPDTYVRLSEGPQIAPPDAGEVLYTWTAGTFSASGALSGTIYRSYLQGNPARTPYYGSAAGQSCTGCHSVSPDGKYVAMIEQGNSSSMIIVDARTGGAIPVPGTAAGQFPAWRPDVNSNPPYQFVFNDGNVLKIASISTGVIRELQGANDQNFIQTQPSWGPNGTIAFVKGKADGGADVEYGINGPSDLLTVPEAGGTATPLPGASGNGGGNYYPEYSPNGKFIAYTFSPAGKTTRAAEDSVIRLYEVSNNAIRMLPQLNAGIPNSWPTWARDGSFLSFSSLRSGGTGSADIYYAPVDQNTGVDGPAAVVPNVNTLEYDHIARWAFLP